MVEIPEARKCCFCLPLRRGLLAWVYIKLVIVFVILSFVILMYVVLLFIHFFEPQNFELALVMYVQVMLALEMIFDILFIISFHKKKYKFLQIYYRLQLATLVNDVILLVGFITYVAIESQQLSLNLGSFVGIGFFILSVIALQTYFIYLVRSEMRNVQLTTQFKFKNFADEPECTAQITE